MGHPRNATAHAIRAVRAKSCEVESESENNFGSENESASEENRQIKKRQPGGRAAFFVICIRIRLLNPRNLCGPVEIDLQRLHSRSVPGEAEFVLVPTPVLFG